MEKTNPVLLPKLTSIFLSLQQTFPLQPYARSPNHFPLSFPSTFFSFYNLCQLIFLSVRLWFCFLHGHSCVRHSYGRPCHPFAKRNSSVAILGPVDLSGTFIISSKALYKMHYGHALFKWFWQTSL